MATTIGRLMHRAACVVLASLIGFGAYAQDSEDASLEVTIRLLPENAAGPEEITRRIELPPAAAAVLAPLEQPAEGPPPGAEDGRGQGLDVAGEARERGREVGQDVAEQARENRENAGRPDDAGPPSDRPSPPDTPRGPPETPPGGPPETPPRGPPETPPGRP